MAFFFQISDENHYSSVTKVADLYYEAILYLFQYLNR